MAPAATPEAGAMPVSTCVGAGEGRYSVSGWAERITNGAHR